jgi:hypothetical protein
VDRAGGGCADWTTSPSRWSLWSDGSILSIASRGSILSVGSVGSCLSVASVGSAVSAASLLSAGSVLAVMSFRARRAVLRAGDGGSASSTALPSLAAIFSHRRRGSEPTGPMARRS